MRLTPSQCIARIVGRVVALRARSEREVTGPWVVAQVGVALNAVGLTGPGACRSYRSFGFEAFQAENARQALIHRAVTEAHQGMSLTRYNVLMGGSSIAIMAAVSA